MYIPCAWFDSSWKAGIVHAHACRTPAAPSGTRHRHAEPLAVRGSQPLPAWHSCGSDSPCPKITPDGRRLRAPSAWQTDAACGPPMPEWRPPACQPGVGPCSAVHPLSGSLFQRMARSSLPTVETRKHFTDRRVGRHLDRVPFCAALLAPAAPTPGAGCDERPGAQPGLVRARRAQARASPKPDGAGRRADEESSAVRAGCERAAVL